MAYRRTDKVIRRLAARHDAIIAAARSLASEHGMEAVQIAPVAARAGIAAGTVYRYFPSKTDLVAALVTAVSARELGAMRAAADAAPGPLSALAAAITTFAARAMQQRRLAWAVLAEPVESDVDPARRAYREALIAEFRARLMAAADSTNPPEGVPQQTAPALLGALMEGLIGPLAPPPATEPKQQREAVQRMTLFCLRGLGIVDARARGLVVQTAVPEMPAEAD